MPHLHRGCNLVPLLCDHKTGQVAVDGAKEGEEWHSGRSDLAMDAMLATNVWTCSRQSTPRRLVTHGSHHRGRRMDAQGSPIGRPVKMHTAVNIVYQFERCFAFLVPPGCLFWPTNNVHWAITVATAVPRFGDHGNYWTTVPIVLPPPYLLCTTCCATTAGSRRAQWLCCSSYTETELSGPGVCATTKRPVIIQNSIHLWPPGDARSRKKLSKTIGW